MIDVNLSCVSKTVFTTTLFTPVKMLFFATFKQPVIITFNTGEEYLVVLLGVLFKTSKKDDIKDTILSWYFFSSAFAKGTSYSSMKMTTCFLKCL